MAYSGRRGPNVSQFIANLNSGEPLPPGDDLLSHQDDLSLLVNTDFIDFDMSDNMNTNFDVAPSDPLSRTHWTSPTSPVQTDFFGTDFSFADLDSFPPIDANGSNFGNPLAGGLKSTIGSPSLVTSSDAGLSGPNAGDKRKLSAVAHVEDVARVAAEEDKRRRNTAASARFRVKKKQREQALEKTAKEMSEKAAMLEAKVQQLEMENKWLKGLITERDLGSGLIGREAGAKAVGKVALDEMYEKFKREEKSTASDSD